MILFLVTDKQWDERRHVVTLANSREDAKRAAHPTLLHNPDHYTVSPLTGYDERVYLNLGNVQVV